MMRKLLSLAAVLSVLVLLSACDLAGQKGAQTAVVDANRVMQECKSGVESFKYFEDLSERLRKELEPIQAKVAEGDEEAAQQFREVLAKSQQKLNSEQQRIFGLLQDNFTKVLNEYRTANKLSVVLLKNQVLSYDASVDITDNVIAAMDKLDLKIVPEDTMGEGSPEPAAPPSAQEEEQKQ